MKPVLITGANKGIGLETAKQLLEEGFYVYLASRDLNNGLDAVEALKSQGYTSVEAIQFDVTDEESVKSARKAIGKKTASLDVLINNAGNNGGEVEDAGRRIAKYAMIDQNGPTGKYFSEESNPAGGEIPW